MGLYGELVDYARISTSDISVATGTNLSKSPIKHSASNSFTVENGILYASVSLLKPQSTSMRIFDMQGNLVKRMAYPAPTDGWLSIAVCVKDLAPGVYVAKLTSNAGKINDKTSQLNATALWRHSVIIQ